MIVNNKGKKTKVKLLSFPTEEVVESLNKMQETDTYWICNKRGYLRLLVKDKIKSMQPTFEIPINQFFTL